MGILDTFETWKQGLLADREAAAEARRQERELPAVRALLGRYGTETAGQIGPALMSENPALRQAGLGLLEELTQPRDMTPYQQAQVGRWQQEAAEFAQSFQLRQEELRARQEALQVSTGLRRETVAQSWERLGQQYRPTPTQGGSLAQTEWAVGQLGELLRVSKPEYFGFVSDNVGEAALEFKNRFGTDEGFSDYWNLLDNLRIEINSGRLSGVLTDQDMRLLNSIWPKRSDAPEVAFKRLGTLQEILGSKRDMALQGIRYSGRRLPVEPSPVPGGSAPGAPASPQPPHGFQRVP